MQGDIEHRWPIEEIRFELMDESDENPNEMSDDQFSALVEEILTSGWLVPMQLIGPKPDGHYDIMGGHHRRRAGIVIGYESAPSVIMDPDVFDEDVRDVQLVKQNVLHGNMNPEKFTALYNRLAESYDADVLRYMMAFTKKDAFDKVYNDARKALPPEMAASLDAVKDELKTVDDLSLVLNKLFTQYGNTLDCHFMVFSWGGKDNIMIRIDNPSLWGRLKKLGDWCMENEQPMDEVFAARMNWPV